MQIYCAYYYSHVYVYIYIYVVYIYTYILDHWQDTNYIPRLVKSERVRCDIIWLVSLQRRTYR